MMSMSVGRPMRVSFQGAVFEPGDADPRGGVEWSIYAPFDWRQGRSAFFRHAPAERASA